MNAPGAHQLTAAERDALAEAERRGLPFLSYCDRHDRQRLMQLPESGGSISIGRDSWMYLCLGWDEQVSRVHSRLDCIGNEWTVADEGLSTNGTFLDDVLVQGRRRLKDGDRLRVGETTILVRVPRGQDAGATVIADAPGPTGD